MNIGIDFGISNIDVAIESKSELKFFSFASSQDSVVDKFHEVMEKLDLPIAEIKSVSVTGGKSSDIPNLYNSIYVSKVNEVQAIGCGAKQIYDINEDSFVVVSAGTGTACVSYQNGEFHHLGGISVGGGTLQGLSNLILKEGDADKIEENAQKGNKNNIDDLIGDVVNDIGSLHPDITASNFVKAKRSNDLNNNDIAASLTNMTGEVIGTISYLNALLVGVDRVYFIGRTSLLDSVRDGIDKRLKLAGVTGKYKANREFANAIGALAYLKPKI